MRPFWSDISRIRTRIRRAQGLALFLDVDGTLAPIADTPEQVHISAAVSALVRSLAQSPRIRLFAVSGRALRDVKKLLPVPGLSYAGNHGLEWDVDKKTGQAHGIAGYLRIHRRLRRDLHTLLGAYPGAFIEDKRLTLSVHYRGFSGNERALLRAVNAGIRRYQPRDVTIMRNKKTVDIRPATPWAKGQFCRMVLHRDFPVYIGDDRTDEDAFTALARGITVRVGRSFVSRAQYYISEQSDTENVLRFILESRSQI